MATSEDEIHIIGHELALANKLIGEVTEKIDELGAQRERMLVLSSVFTKALKDLEGNPVQSALAIESEE